MMKWHHGSSLGILPESAMHPLMRLTIIGALSDINIPAIGIIRSRVAVNSARPK